LIQYANELYGTTRDSKELDGTFGALAEDAEMTPTEDQEARCSKTASTGSGKFLERTRSKP
jgi:hypothetical protein